MRTAKRRGRSRALGVILTGLFGAGGVLYPLSADCIPMEKLLDGEKIVIGDKSFENWRAYQSLGSFGAQPVPSSEITVSPDPDDPLAPGLTYSTDKWTVDQGERQTTTWEYDVRTLSNKKLIKDISLDFGGSLDSTGMVIITELVRDADDNVITSEIAFARTTVEHRPATANFPPQNFLKIRKTVFLDGGPDVNGHASVSELSQRFSQIPEPSVLWLVSTGFIGLIIACRRESIRKLSVYLWSADRWYAINRRVE